MKLKPKKLKTKKAPKSSEELAQLADELGDQYARASDNASITQKAKLDIVTRIKLVAKELGEFEGTSCVLRGHKYEVGYQTVGGRQSVDWELFRSKYPKLYKKLCSFQIDMGLVEAAIQDGTLPRPLLQKFTIQTAQPTERLVVRQVGEEVRFEE